MNWFVFAFLAWVVVGLDAGVKSALWLPLGSATIAPSFVLPLAVFVAMYAPGAMASWACLVLGLLVDLTTPASGEPGALIVLGPHAIGYLIAGQYVLAMRGLMLRGNWLTMVFLSVTASAIAELVVTGLFTARMAFSSTMLWQPTLELAQRMGSSVATGLSAAILAIVLMPLKNVIGFQTGHARSWPKR